MIKKSLHVFVLSLLFLLVSSTSALAVNLPSFPSCINPQGNIKASYDSGNHGIVGSANNYSGKDTVYSQENGNALQCFCASDGQGIQTNWVKATGYSQEEINILRNSGWVYIPNGSLWGLDPAPYLAQNSNFSCRGNSNSGGGSTNSNNGSSNNGSSNNTSGTSDPAKSVLGAAVLAGTGNLRTILYMFGLSVGTLISALLLKKFSK